MDAKKQAATAAEIRRLPQEDRDAILLAAASKAARDYETDGELTAFEAFGPEDFQAD
jgi:acyl-CoA reductase-like NAD-dependent aldehyde dehydrogenase